MRTNLSGCGKIAISTGKPCRMPGCDGTQHPAGDYMGNDRAEVYQTARQAIASADETRDGIEVTSTDRGSRSAAVLLRAEIGPDGPVGDLPDGAVWLPDLRQIGFVPSSDASIEVMVRAGAKCDLRMQSDFKGEAILDGPGDGSVIRDGLGEGDAQRRGSGNGDVGRKGPGKGSARRAGRGKGSARREGGSGAATRTGGGEGRAWKRPHAGAVWEESVDTSADSKDPKVHALRAHVALVEMRDNYQAAAAEEEKSGDLTGMKNSLYMEAVLDTKMNVVSESVWEMNQLLDEALRHENELTGHDVIDYPFHDPDDDVDYDKVAQEAIWSAISLIDEQIRAADLATRDWLNRTKGHLIAAASI